MSIREIIKEKRGTIIDVRIPEEFSGGHVAGSINIPLNEIPQRMEELNRLVKPLVFCCASGNRSGQVYRFMVQQGVECYNAGSWLDVNFYQSQTA